MEAWCNSFTATYEGAIKCTYVQGPNSVNIWNIPEQPGPPLNLWREWNVQS